jgi:hypothetical protein
MRAPAIHGRENAAIHKSSMAQAVKITTPAPRRTPAGMEPASAATQWSVPLLSATERAPATPPLEFAALQAQ